MRALRTSLCIALTFFASAAAAQQPCTPDAGQVVREIYRHILEREAGAASHSWEQQLISGRATVRDVVREVAKSPEHTRRFWQTQSGEAMPYERAVYTLYRHILGRQADPEGARGWAQVGAAQGVATVVDQIVSSPEYQQSFGDWGVPGSGGMYFCGPNATSPSSAAPAEMRFRGMDTNNDGLISQNEWRGSRRSFRVHDWNNDGVLSKEEVRTDTVGRGRSIDDDYYDRAERFDYLDVNNDRRIARGEWHGSIYAFEELDRNRDNSLSQAEFAAAARPDVGGSVGTSGEGQIVFVDVTQRWTDTGIVAQAGDTLTFEASGSAQWSSDPDDVVGPEGSRTRRFAANAPMRNVAAGGLIARIGNSRPVFVGSGRSWRAPVSGRLYLGINDDFLADNTGEFTIKVGVNGR